MPEKLLGNNGTERSWKTDLTNLYQETLSVVPLTTLHITNVTKK